MDSTQPSRLYVAPMKPDDVDPMIAIERQSQGSPWLPQQFIEELQRPNAYIDVAHIRTGPGESEVIGYCNYWLVHDEVHLHNLAIHPTWRRHGIATRLLRQLFAVARHHTCSLVTLEVRVSNHAARNLYRTHGFVTEGIRRGYYADNGDDAAIMTFRF